jgi:hypothetical protein
MKTILTVGRAISVGAVIYFYSRATSLYRLVRECLDHVDDASAFEYCKGYPDSIQFQLIGMTISFFVILVINQRIGASTTSKPDRTSGQLPGEG